MSDGQQFVAIRYQPSYFVAQNGVDALDENARQIWRDDQLIEKRVYDDPKQMGR